MGLAAKKIAAWKLELQKLATQHNGKLKAEDVVEFAKDPTTSLHSHFTWDDTEAARRYRLDQARDLIQVVVTVIPGAAKEFRAYVSMEDDRKEAGGGYRFMVSVLSDKEKRERLLAQALAEFDRWREKYEALTELAGIISARKKIS